MFVYLLLGFIVIVLVCLIYWVAIDSDNAKRARVNINMARSCGVFDASARVALATLGEIVEPGAADLILRANIMRYNVAENEPTRLRGPIAAQIAADYVLALNLMQEENVQNTDFIIHHIDEFGRQNNNDNLLHAVHTTGGRIQQQTIDERVKVAVDTSATRADAIATALDSATIYTDNRQNVHDSKINSDLRNVLAELKANCTVDPSVCIDSARSYIEKQVSEGNLSRQRADDALKTLTQVARGDSISTYNDTESGIFVATWARCSHPRNVDRKDLMRDAIIDALADSVEGGTLVCINGRTARVLNSLATLDYSPVVASGALTYEAHRNQIFQETKDIIDTVLNNAKENPELKLVATAYDGGDPVDDPIAEEKLNVLLRNAINANIANYSSKFTPDELQKIEQECHIYAAI